MKKGITVSMIATFIAVMMILAATIAISADRTIERAKLRSFATEINIIQDKVKQKLKEGTDSSYMTNAISVDLTDVNSSIVTEQFEGESIDGNKKVELYKLDLDALQIYNTKYGKEETEKDIYAVSQDTGKVYYVAGIKTNGTTYYTLTDNLENQLGNKYGAIEETKQIKFLPSDIYWTNAAITTTVIYPQTFSNVSITATNTSGDTFSYGTPYLRDNSYEVIVNTSEIKTNYTITVSYTKDSQSKTEIFKVENFDNTAPTISVGGQMYTKSSGSSRAYILDVSATDDESGVKVIKYESEDITLENASKYFKTYGTELKDNKILMNNTAIVYTIYAEDNVGNIAVQRVEVSADIIAAR